MRLSVLLGALLTYAALVYAEQPVYAQCGGLAWTGATNCGMGSGCTKVNNHYSQCLPDPQSSSSTSASLSSSSGVPVSSASRTTFGTATIGAVSSSAAAPTATANISPKWTAALAKAKVAVGKLTLQDKISLATGVGWQNGNCVGNTAPIASISYPGLCAQDSPLGVRYADKVSVFSAGINAGASFNRTLMRQRGIGLGEEARGKGVHVLLGPDMNVLRAPAGGRGWEGFGADPYLSAEGSYETIIGMQSAGAQACAKHYINNEQEHFRDSSSSVVDDRTQHEVYARPFLRSVQADVASVMCSYSMSSSSGLLNPHPDVLWIDQINGSYACENDKTLNGILKNEFGFQGYVMSDWAATHSTLSVNKGLDMTMPGDITFGSNTTYFGSTLVNAVQAGTVTQARIDDLATRILGAWFLVGQDSGYPAVNFNSWNVNAPVNKHVDVQGSHKTGIRALAAASTVLLKNTNRILPINNKKTIAIIGNGAGAAARGPNGFTDRGGDDGVLAVGWGSGTADFPYLITPLAAITARAQVAGATVSSSTSDTDLNAAATTAAGKDVALVFLTADSGEGYITVEGNAGDRNNLKAWHNGDALVARVASVNSHVIVVVNSVGAIDVESWIDHPNVTALVWSGLPGQEAGNGVADVIFGDYNPSGRLPYTIAKNIADYSAQVLYTSSTAVPNIAYSEGIFVDYKHFDQAGIKPRYEFGFGLSYTTFQYSNLVILGDASGGSPPAGPGSSLDPWLHTKVVTVNFTVKNNGTVAGHEIPQLYISLPGSTAAPPRELRGFDSVYVSAGTSISVSMQLSRFDLAFWNVITQRFEVPAGKTTISIGASSRDIRLTGSISL